MSKKNTKPLSYYVNKYFKVSDLYRETVVREALYHAERIGMLKNFDVFKTNISGVLKQTKTDFALLHTINRLYQARQQKITDIAEIFGNEGFKTAKFHIKKKSLFIDGSVNFEDVKVAPGFNRKTYEQINRQKERLDDQLERYEEKGEPDQSVGFVQLLQDIAGEFNRLGET